MNDLEDRVRRALHADFRDIATDPLLGDVHRGATRRRRRRTAGAVVASALVVAGAVGIATQVGGDPGASPDPLPATQSPAPTQPPLPEGATQGVVDVSVASPDHVFRLTTNIGCVACSTVWRQDSAASGGWERLHDFGRDSYVGKVDATYGPVTDLVMAVDGVDGWAWGQRLYSTHDGGQTWAPVTVGPGRLDTEFGHQVRVTDEYAWSLLRTDQGLELWRTELGSDDWSRADAPDMAGVSGMLTTAAYVGLETSDEGLSAPRVQYSNDGKDWKELDNPCSGENQTYPGESAVFIICADRPATESSPSATATVYRSTDLTTWTEFGRSTSVITGVHALGDDDLLLVHEHSRATMLTHAGSTTVDLGLQPGEETFQSDAPWSGDVVMLATSDLRLVGSTDRGRTWHIVGDPPNHG